MKNRKLKNSTTPKFFMDWWLLLILFSLITISFLAIFGSKAMYYNNGLGLRWENNEIKQLIWLGVSIVIILIIIYLGNDFFRKYSRIFYLSSTFLLVYILVGKYIPGIKSTVPQINGATRWIVLPGFQLQPSEFVKIFIIFSASKVAADFIEKSFEPNPKAYQKLMFKIIGISFIPILLIFLQPDTGIPTVMVISIFTILFTIGVPWRYIFIIVSSVLGFFLIIYLLYHIPFSRNIIDSNPTISYRFSRIESFISGSDGTTANSGFQTASSLTNIGSAGFFGHGFQNTFFYTPESQTDFIFTIIASDFGFVGALVTMSLSLLLDVRIYKIIKKSANPFDVYVGSGFIMILIFQQFFNIGMALGLLPVKGMTLPFISYGGTSLLSYAIVIGFILNIHSRNVNSQLPIHTKPVKTIKDSHLQKELENAPELYSDQVPEDILNSSPKEDVPTQVKPKPPIKSRFVK